MDMNGKRYLIVGGAGMIGSHTVDELIKEDVAEIRIYDNFSRGSEENLENALKDPRVKLFEFGGDLLHRDILDVAMRGIDGVFHFAALWLLHCHEFPRSAYEVNIGGTFNILEAMLNNGVKRLVYSSSASVYGDAVEEPMTEHHPYNNTNFYGATKIAGEHMCRALYHRYKGTEKHFEYVGLRYMNVYGPRQDYHGAYIAVMMKILDRLDAARLVGADDPRRPALDPTGGVQTGNGVAFFGGHAAALVGNDPPVVAKRHAGNRHPPVAHAAEQDSTLHILRYTGAGGLLVAWIAGEFVLFQHNFTESFVAHELDGAFQETQEEPAFLVFAGPRRELGQQLVDFRLPFVLGVAQLGPAFGV